MSGKCRDCRENVGKNLINGAIDSVITHNGLKGLIETLSVTTIQRLGFVFERIVKQPELAQKLYRLTLDQKIKFFMQPLKAGGKRTGFEKDEKWKIIINADIEIDE